MSYATPNAVLYNIDQNYPETSTGGASKQRARNNIGAAASADLNAEILRATDAEKAAKTELVAGTGVSITSTLGLDGQTIYTVSDDSVGVFKTKQNAIDQSYADYGFISKLKQTTNGVVSIECSYISAATDSVTGLMSYTDKSKLDNIQAGAEVNQNAFSGLKVGSTTIYADQKSDTLELIAGSNITLTPDDTNDTVTIAATDTTYNVFNTTTDGLVPKSGANTDKFLKGDGTWGSVTAGSLIQKLDYGDMSASNVSTLLIDSDDADGYACLKADSSNKGFLVVGPYKGLLDSGINGGSGKGADNLPLYIDGNSQFATCTRMPKRSHQAELYWHHDQDGTHYNVRNVKNGCINHVAVTNHSADVCYVYIEAPTLDGSGEEYDYTVVFDCTNSSGSCSVDVEDCFPEIFWKPYLINNVTPNQIGFQETTYTQIAFSGSPMYQVEVLGYRFTVHKFG